jgi:hypothetical protein
MEVSGQIHAPAPLYPQGKSPWYLLDRRLGEPQSRSGRGGEEKNFQPPPGIEPRTPIVQPVTQSYTDWAITAPISWLTNHLLTSQEDLQKKREDIFFLLFCWIRTYQDTEKLAYSWRRSPNSLCSNKTLMIAYTL